MRRRQRVAEPIDDRLRRFVADEWPGAVTDAWTAWTAARRAHVETFPRGQLGDVVHRIRAERAQRRRLLADGVNVRPL